MQSLYPVLESREITYAHPVVNFGIGFACPDFSRGDAKIYYGARPCYDTRATSATTAQWSLKPHCSRTWRAR